MDVTLVEEDEDRRSKSCQLDGRSKRARESTEGTLVGKRVRGQGAEDNRSSVSAGVQKFRSQEFKRPRNGSQESRSEGGRS